MKGLANIPVLIALALIIGITPFAINQVQKSQILQNRAATICGCSEEENNYCRGEWFTLSCNTQIKCPGKRNCQVPPQVTNQVPCSDLYNAQIANCSTLNSTKTDKSVPCYEITNAISTYCKTSPVISLVPTKPIYPTPYVTKAPMGTPIIINPSPRPINACSVGQTKCVGRMIFRCTGKDWAYSQVCSNTCIDGKCIPTRTPGPIRTY